jgi:hypothetical protein
MQGQIFSQHFFAAPGPSSSLIVQRLPARLQAETGRQRVTISLFLTLVPMLFAVGFASPGDGPRVRSLVVENEIILRIPVQPLPRELEWVERNGPKCISTGIIRGAFLSRGDHVDMLLTGRRMLRARFSADCPALDFYEGFYLSSEDEQICAGRDAIRSRMGATCRIDSFSRLMPQAR